MFLYKTFLQIFIFIKFVNADVIVCENNECKRAGLINMDSFLYELDIIKEGHQNVIKLLKELNERLDSNIATITTEIEKIKHIINDQNEKAHEIQKKDEKAKESVGIDNSLYDNLWIVIQTRQDGSVDFYRNWTEYKQGFGNQEGEFFVGLDKIYELTNDRDHELLVILEDFESAVKFAHYDHFVIGDETERYRLKELGSYSGTAGNYLKFHTKKYFSTKDSDNDDADDGNCAHWFKGAWWYYNCMTSNLNGPYRYNGTLGEKERGVGVTWGSFDQIKFSYKATQMLLRVKV